MSWWNWFSRPRPKPTPSPYPITGRDDEFRATITILYREELGRDPDESGMANFLHAAQWGTTGEQIRAALHNSPEGVAYRERPPEDPPASSRPFPPEVGALVTNGTKFIRQDGTIFGWRGATWFLGYARYLRGEDVRPHLARFVALGRF